MSVASLGWVTPGQQLRVSPLYFFPKNLVTFFCSLLSLTITIAFYPFYTGVTPLEGVTPHLFLPVRPRFSAILCKFAHKFFFLLVSPLWRVSPGAVRALPRPSSPSDATDKCVCMYTRMTVALWILGHPEPLVCQCLKVVFINCILLFCANKISELKNRD